MTWLPYDVWDLLLFFYIYLNDNTEGSLASTCTHLPFHFNLSRSVRDPFEIEVERGPPPQHPFVTTGRYFYTARRYRRLSDVITLPHLWSSGEPSANLYRPFLSFLRSGLSVLSLSATENDAVCTVKKSRHVYSFIAICLVFVLAQFPFVFLYFYLYNLVKTRKGKDLKSKTVGDKKVKKNSVDGDGARVWGQQGFCQLRSVLFGRLRDPLGTRWDQTKEARTMKKKKKVIKVRGRVAMGNPRPTEMQQLR